jgi:hypothetical protein
MQLSELQFEVLNTMADDYEDIEQIYISANKLLLDERRPAIRFPLSVLIDEVNAMLAAGLIEAKISSDERLAPLDTINPGALHHYWFCPTESGRRAWKAHPNEEAASG